jgi:hypothetical protein
MYGGTINTYCFFWGFFKMSETHRHWKIWTGSSPAKQNSKNNNGLILLAYIISSPHF